MMMLDDMDAIIGGGELYSFHDVRYVRGYENGHDHDDDAFCVHARDRDPYGNLCSPSAPSALSAGRREEWTWR